MATIKRKYTPDELTKINEFLLFLLRESRYGRIRLVYRGDKLENLFQRLNVIYDPKVPDFKELLSRLFMVGEKGRHFYTNLFTGIEGGRISIDNLENETFDHIFDEINKVAKSKKKHHIEFFRKNDNILKFFESKINKDHFIDKVNTLPRPVKLRIKIYYLTLLHQLAAINYKRKSALLSTTENKNVAKRFADHSRSMPAFLLHIWTPTPIILNRNLGKLNLPQYSLPFKEQEEVSFFAGILPHYIIGFEVIGKKSMFYNPAILTNKLTPRIAIEGLDIDQTNFEYVFKQTNYSSFFSTDGLDFIQH